jgi:hypothetical protein
MQEAYAAEDMLRARILYLKIKGIDVTSDDDPRINEVRDEDFVFVPGGELVLDEESLAALKEAERRDREQRTRDELDHQRRVNDPHRGIRSGVTCHQQPKTRSTRFELDMKLRVREQVSTSVSPSQRRELQVRSSKFGRINTVSDLSSWIDCCIEPIVCIEQHDHATVSLIAFHATLYVYRGNPSVHFVVDENCSADHLEHVTI